MHTPLLGILLLHTKQKVTFTNGYYECKKYDTVTLNAKFNTAT